MSRYACAGSAASALLALLAATQPVRADDRLFRATAMLLSGGPAAPLGQDDRGSLVDVYTFAGGAAGAVISPGADPCVVQQWTVTDRQDGWAESVTATFDFRKVTAVRWLADGDDFESAASRDPADPTVSLANLDGEDWNCQRWVKLDPARPTTHMACNDGWTIVLVAASDRMVVREALDLVRAACFRQP